MKKLFMGAIAALALSMAVPAVASACQPVNAAGSVGYVNVRAWPDLNAPVVIRWNNPERGSDWGSGRYCYEETYDRDGRLWSKVYLEMKDGRLVTGWVSDKVLQFL